MKKNAELFLNKILGDDFFQSFGDSLTKSEIYKPGTRTVTDTNDLFQGLQIVPKVLLNLLIRELSGMNIDEIKEVKIPVEDTFIRVTKHERDSFSGQVFQNNVKISDFMHRSIPGIGLVLLSVLELYDMDELEEQKPIDSNMDQKINKLIDERLELHSLVNKVVDGKLMQRDAVQQLLMSKLNQMSLEHQKIKEEHKEIKETPKAEEKPIIVVLDSKKIRPLEKFVEDRKKKLKKKEFTIEMVKSETIDCPDCGQNIFSDSGISACLCFGFDMGRKVYLKKTENGIKLSFPKAWSVDNIEMLLEVLRNQKNG
jgi:hypothetical protein